MMDYEEAVKKANGCLVQGTPITTQAGIGYAILALAAAIRETRSAVATSPSHESEGEDVSSSEDLGDIVDDIPF